MIVILAALLATPAAAPAKQWPACAQGRLRPAQSDRRAGPHKLNQEPPARQLYTVLRVEDGCTRPVYVNDRAIGGAPRR